MKRSALLFGALNSGITVGGTQAGTVNLAQTSYASSATSPDWAPIGHIRHVQLKP